MIARIVMHVADRVDMHHEGHERHDDHHQCRKPVDEKTDFHVQAVDNGPGIQTVVLRLAAVPYQVFQYDG